MKYQMGMVTDVGKVREVNQDRAYSRVGKINGGEAALLAVADGMGGLSHGEIASGLACTLLDDWWRSVDGKRDVTQEELSKSLDAAICEAHRQVYFFAEKQKKRVGSTLSVLLLCGKRYLTKQIGDSRIYVSFPDGAVHQLTQDQTWCNKKIAEGVMTPQEAANHRMSHALVNALGVSQELAIETGSGSFDKKTGFLICSDGFYHGTEGLVERGGWNDRTPPQEILERMLREILKGAAADNITAVLCHCRSRSKEADNE